MNLIVSKVKKIISANTRKIIIAGFVLLFFINVFLFIDSLLIHKEIESLIKENQKLKIHIVSAKAAIETSIDGFLIQDKLPVHWSPTFIKGYLEGIKKVLNEDFEK